MPAIASSSAGKPEPVSVDVLTSGTEGHRPCTSSISIRCGQSSLFTTTIIALPLDATSLSASGWVPVRDVLASTVSSGPPKPMARSSSETRWSCSVKRSEPSNTSKTTSALSAAARLRCTPICSTGLSLGVMPAVSMRCSGMPRRLATSSTVSRVVPATGVTIARSVRNNALSRLDLPTFGRPIMAVRNPCR